MRELRCPECEARIRISVETTRSQVRCPRCRHVFRIGPPPVPLTPPPQGPDVTTLVESSPSQKRPLWRFVALTCLLSSCLTLGIVYAMTRTSTQVAHDSKSNLNHTLKDVDANAIQVPESPVGQVSVDTAGANVPLVENVAEQNANGEPTGSAIVNWRRNFAAIQLSPDTEKLLEYFFKSNVPFLREAFSTPTTSPEALVIKHSMPLIEHELVDPLTHVSYTTVFSEQAGAFLLNGKQLPTLPVIANLRNIAQSEPKLGPFIADVLRLAALKQLAVAFRQDRPVGLSDEILFSHDWQDKVSAATVTFSSPQLKGELLCSVPATRERYREGPRFWFLNRLIDNPSQSLLITGIWTDLIALADEIDSESKTRWDVAFTEVVYAFAERRRFTSAIIVLASATSGDLWEFLTYCTDNINPDDELSVRNLLIALAMQLELSFGSGNFPLPTPEQFRGTPASKVCRWLRQHTSSSDFDKLLRCAKFDPTLFAD